MRLERVEDHGSFEAISFALLLIRALDKRWTGTLVVSPDEAAEPHLIQLDRGLVCRVLAPDEHARLGELLTDDGAVMAKELEEALERDMLVGQALTSANVIDDKTLQRALVLQVLKRLERLFAFGPSTTWSYGSELTAFDGMPEGVRVDTLRVLWAGLSTHGEMGNWQALTMKRIGDTPFQVRRDVNLRRFGFTGDVTNVVRVIHEERVNTLELFTRAIAPEDVVQQIVYLLAITRYLDFSPAGASTSAPPARHDSIDEMPSISEESTVDETPTSSEPPTSSEKTEVQQPRRVARIRLRRVAVKASAAAPDPPGSGEPRISSSPSGRGADPGGAHARDAMLSEIQSRLARLEAESPFTLLDIKPEDIAGMSDDALIDHVWACYEEASKRWDPENCPNELSELREGVQKIHDAMGEALAVLLEDELRAEALAAHVLAHAPELAARKDLTSTLRSDAPPAPPSSAEHATGEVDDAPPSGERATDLVSFSPVELHARALMALSQQRPDEALRLCSAACSLASDNPDYVATSVWIRASMARPDLKVLELELDDLIQIAPDHVSARYYRGVLRRRLGNDASARRDFEHVLHLDPAHTGAQNQLAQPASAGHGST